MPESDSPAPQTTGRTFVTRAAIFALSTLVLWILLATFYRASPSERFHIIVPGVWAIDFIVFRLKQSRLRWNFVIGVTGGVFAGLWYFLLLRANSMGGRVDWREPLWWMLFIASLFVLYHWLCTTITQIFRLTPKMRELMDAPRGWWLRLVRMGVAIVFFVPYLYTACNIHRFKIANATDPQREYGLSYEDVTFSATDGVPLKGWFIPARGSRATVLVVHGISSNKSDFLAFAPFLHRAGFNVFIFDQRGHGDSPGHTVSLGYYEARDVRGAVQYLSRRPDTKSIVGYGFSMGGSSLLHAMPHLPTVRGVVVDATFADLKQLGYDQMAFLPWPVANVMMRASALWTRLELGIPLTEISPRRHIGIVSPRPLLIIHGVQDGVIPPSQAHLNFEAAAHPKELWLVPRAGHVQSMRAQEQEYQRRVVKFLKRCANIPFPDRAV